MLQPGLAEGGELALEPAGYDVDGEAAVGEVVGGRAELGEDAGVPEAGVDGGDDLQTLGRQEQGEAEAGRLVLVLGAVAGHVADLAEGVLEAVVLGEDGEFAVVLPAPVGALLDLAGDKSPADVGDPIGEFHGRGGHAELLLRNVLGTPNSRGCAGAPREARASQGVCGRGEFRRGKANTRGGSRGGDQAAARQEALETRARSTWRRRVRSSRIFMPSIVTAVVDDRQGEPDRSRIPDH